MKKRCPGNLRPAPGYITPDVVRRVLEQADRVQDVAEGGTAPQWVPVVTLPPAKPRLHLVEKAPSFRPTAKDALAERRSRAIRIAFDREIGVPEVAAALGISRSYVCQLGKAQGLAFGRHRLALIEPITFDQLLALDDPAVPTPAFAPRDIDPAIADRDRAIRIAHERGISLKDVAESFGIDQNAAQVFAHRRSLRFGRRSQLIEPITLKQLLALADPTLPTPLTEKDARESEKAARADQIERARTAAKAEREASRERLRRAREAELDVITEQAPAVRPSAPAARPRPAPPSPARAAPPSVEVDSGRERQAFAHRRSLRTQAANARQRFEAGVTSDQLRSGAAKMAARAIEDVIREEVRLACPVEQAKLALQRKGRVVYSMKVYGGDPDLFFVSGLGRDVTEHQLRAEAERVSA